MRKTMIALSLVVLAAGAARADDCRYTDSRDAALDATGIATLQIEAEAGSLRVEGRDDISEVRVRGTACAGDRDLLADIRLDTGRRGDRLRLDVEIPDETWSWGWSSPRLDLVVEVPSRLAVEIEDGSGSIEVRNVAALDVYDGSGGIEIEDVHGDVVLEDGSGEIDVDGVAGTLTIAEDGSGSISIRDVVGDVDIREDGSGSIDVRDVDGSVRIREDGSGSIEAFRVAGDFDVDRDGSGGIRFDRIGGRVRVP